MKAFEYLAHILDVDPIMLHDLDGVMTEKMGKSHVLERVHEELERSVRLAMETLNSGIHSASHIRSILRKTILLHEKQVMDFLEIIKGKDEFERASLLVKKIATAKKGFFLKKDFARKVLEMRKPENLLKYTHTENIEALLAKHDVLEVFSALRFVESNEWMHETFEKAYSMFTAADFEEREIEIRVLGPEWQAIAKQFVAKKHHNVSHLKEFGVIFLNPIRENVPGKFLRDLALLFHYTHEIEFYSKLFKRYSAMPNFSERLKQLLRGDVSDRTSLAPGEWLIVQRYLFKENPKDPRLFLPRVNPESIHWTRGQRDLVVFTVVSEGDLKLDLRLWENLDWVACICAEDKESVVSFDLEDNAMALASFMEGDDVNFNYHQREAMWTKIFSEYAGGEKETERLLIENFDKGVITF